MCNWNENTSMSGDQVILDMPEWLDINKNNRSICIDRCIVEQIKILWESNIETLGCCCGHGKEKFDGISLIVDSKYSDEEIKYITSILSVHDDRKWKVFQWRSHVLQKVGIT